MYRRDEIKLSSQIGSGATADVWRGSMNVCNKQGDDCFKQIKGIEEVAIKVFKMELLCKRYDLGMMHKKKVIALQYVH